MKSKYKEDKKYSAITALYEKKIVLFKRNGCLIIQENGDVFIAKDTVATENATYILKTWNSVSCFSDEVK